ncbi:MAG: hypothetical protein GC134_01770 [Proteobacteria bacterium]|nr:hypothetical protein [Pseudomonadota bacterium]
MITGKVSRYLATPLLVLFGLAVVYVVCINLYVRYAPYELPKPTGVVPDLSAFKPDEASPIPLAEQQQIWVAEQYLYDHEGKYQNPQHGNAILDEIAKSDNAAAAYKAMELRVHDAWLCTETIPFIYQFKDWRLHHLARITPVSDAELLRIYFYWQKVYEQDKRSAHLFLKSLMDKPCLTKNPRYNETFGKHTAL